MSLAYASHVLIGAKKQGTRWRTSCSCGWRSEPRSLPGQTYVLWLSHRIEPSA